MRRSILLGLVLFLLSAAPARGQEVQVPLDQTGRVERIDRRLAERLGLWTQQYPGFQEARLFQAADSSFVLEITRLREGRTVRERLALSPAEVADLRGRVEALLAARAVLDPEGGLNQEGRYLLLGQTTLAGIAFYGWAVPVVLDADDESSAAGLYLLTSAASFFLPFALTDDAPVTFGMANLSRYGVTRGIFHGLLLHELVAGERVKCGPDYCSHESDERAQIGSALLVSVAEGVGGYLWARNEGMSAGTANAIVVGGDAGLFWGLGTARIAGTEDISERTTAAIALPITAAAIVGAHALAQRRDYTWGDADLIFTAGAVGALAGVAAGDLIGGDPDAKGAWAAAMLGSAGGMYVADRMVSHTDFSVGQATLNRLGAIAGALAGASLGAMAENETVALTGAALGAAAGYALTYSALAPDAPAGRGERMPSAAWEVRLQPQGLLASRLLAGSAPAPLPFLMVQRRF
jgi:hypothetical protein